MLLFFLLCLTFDLIDGDHTVGAHHCAARATYAFVVYDMGVVITFAVYILRQLDALHRAGFEAYAAALAVLGIDYDLSFKCHNISFI